MDKLDATPHGVVNGPEDAAWNWPGIDWEQAERDVRRLRQRIFVASREGDLAKVRNLQKLMLRSHANAVVSVRRVAERNAGRKTAGIDGKTVLLPTMKSDLARWAQSRAALWRARPVKRVYIPKASGNGRRPLGIPVIADRALQAMTVNALEPEWEARFEPRSYGFRPGRGCHDAIAAIFSTLCGKTARRGWILDADLAAAFDRIDHDFLLQRLGSFPARGRVAQWLKAGVVEQGVFSRTQEGIPQGGVISPLLLNVALHGMEQAAGVRYHSAASLRGRTRADSVVLIRYADDLVALCHTRQQAEQVARRLTDWLARRGLTFNADKTRIVHVDEGFDFLGFNVRRYHGKLLIKPSTAAIRGIKQRLRTEILALRGANALAVIRKLGPITRGWAAYYRIGVSSRIFNGLDRYVWKLTYRWACYRHPTKNRHWACARYWDRFNPARQDRWVFGDRDSGAYLHKFAWTSIVRHQMVKAGSSVDDPALTEYWQERRRAKHTTRLDEPYRRLLHQQQARCPICGELLLAADRQPDSPQEWEQWLRSTRRAMVRQAITVTNGDHGRAQRLVHDWCRRHPHVDRSPGPALQSVRDSCRLA